MELPGLCPVAVYICEKLEKIGKKQRDQGKALRPLPKSFLKGFEACVDYFFSWFIRRFWQAGQMVCVT